MFRASQILYTKRTGKALYKRTTSSCHYHHAFMRSFGVAVGISCVPLLDSFLVTSFHTLPTYGQKANKCELVYSLILHNGQILGPLKPLFFSISQVNNLLDSASHIVRMVFCGLLIFHNLLHHNRSSSSVCSLIATA